MPRRWRRVCGAAYRIALVAACPVLFAAWSVIQLPALPAGVPDDARLYARNAGGSSGRMAAWRDPDGTIQIVYQLSAVADCQTNIQSVIILDAAGVPIRLQHTGQRCGPSRPVDEEYYRAGSAGRWRNANGQGEGDTAGKRFYVSLTDLPEERALLVRAGIASGGRVPLLPEGEAVVERAQELTIRAGDRTERVTLYRIAGLDVRPSAVWLDSRGELFAFGGFIRQGWEAVGPELQRAEAARGAEDAAVRPTSERREKSRK